jgi:hypothetical protein
MQDIKMIYKYVYKSKFSQLLRLFLTKFFHSLTKIKNTKIQYFV